MKKIPSISLGLLTVGAPTKIPVSAFLLALVLFSLSPAMAVDGTWKAGTGSGVWSATSNWTGDPSPVPGGAGSEVGFDTGTGGSIFVGIDGLVSSRIVGTLNFGGSSPWNIYATDGGTLTFDNSGTDAVINIESSGSSSGNTISAPVVLASSLIVNNDNPNRNLNLNSVISETSASSITKNGSGNLNLSNFAANTFSGGVTLNAGSISVLHNSGFGTGTITLNGGTVVNTGGSRFYNNTLILGGDVTFGNATGGSNTFSGTTTLTGNRILTADSAVNLSGDIGDGGSGYGITKQGAGTMTLSGSNNYSGTFTLDAGGIRLNGTNGFGSGNLIVNGGSIGSSGIDEVANDVTWNADANTAYVGRVDYNGTGTLTGNRILTNVGTTVYNGVIGESGGSWSLTKSGAGTWWFGSGSNSFTGGFTITDGTVNVGSANSLAGGAVTVNGGLLDLKTHSSTVGAVTINGGTVSNTSNTGLLSSSTGFTLTGGTVNAILAGSGGLVKSGTGTATLNMDQFGSPTYTGATLISAGTLIVAGASSINSSSGVTIDGGTLTYNSSRNLSSGLTFSAGTLAGTNWAGTLDGLSIGSGQIINPGNSPGTAATGNQTWAGSGSYVWEINNATGTAGTDPGWDLLTGTGALTLTASGGDQFDINVTSLTLGNVAGDAANFNSLSSYEWMIADFGSAITTFNPSAFNIDTSAFSNAATGAFAVVRGDSISGGDDTELYLVYSAVPEPTTMGLLGLSLTVLVAFRRRRNACGNSDLPKVVSRWE